MNTKKIVTRISGILRHSKHLKHERAALWKLIQVAALVFHIEHAGAIVSSFSHALPTDC